MSSLDNTPVNKNFLSPLNFKFTIKKAPYVNFFVQKVNLPGIMMPPKEAPNPMVNIPYPGDHLKYEPLTLDFKVDEDLQNYFEIHNWIRDLGFPENFGQYRNVEEADPLTGEGIYSDISLVILSSTKMPNYEFTFVDAYPVSISDLNFNTIDTDVNFVTARAQFRYTYYTSQNIT